LCKYNNKLTKHYFKEDLEILISTMNRNSLDFLNSMFPFCDFSNFRILIINQTSKDNLLFSGFESVRVVNAFDKGISKSRNLAILNSKAKILLFTDDDVVFIENFDQKIIEAYNNNPLVSAICFQTLTTEGVLYSNYPKHNKILNNKEIINVLSIEVSCKSDSIKKGKIKFNEWFGLGSQFEDSETFFYLRNLKNKGFRVFFCPLNIVIHKPFSSSDDAKSDRVVYARMAGYYKRFGFLAYVFLFKYMFFLFRRYNFSFLELHNKYFIGLKSIKDYKLLVNQNLDSKYE
jgi:glycosyltransferase involved in cell wall biosynthesis